MVHFTVIVYFSKNLLSSFRVWNLHCDCICVYGLLRGKLKRNTKSKYRKPRIIMETTDYYRVIWLSEIPLFIKSSSVAVQELADYRESYFLLENQLVIRISSAYQTVFLHSLYFMAFILFESESVRSVECISPKRGLQMVSWKCS